MGSYCTILSREVTQSNSSFGRITVATEMGVGMEQGFWVRAATMMQVSDDDGFDPCGSNEKRSLSGCILNKKNQSFHMCGGGKRLKSRMIP